jgi:hypothetical protein
VATDHCGAAVSWPQPCLYGIVLNRQCATLLIPGILAGGCVLQAAQIDTTLSASEKAAIRLKRMVDPLSLVYSVAAAGIGQWRDEPPAWQQGAGGVGRRFAASEGWKVTQNSLALGFDTAFGLDPRFHPSRETAFWPRLRGALSQTLVAYTDSGGRAFNFSEVGSSYGASFLSNSWFPAHYNGAGDALERGTIGLGLNTASNVVKEFWPDIRRKVLRRGK